MYFFANHPCSRRAMLTRGGQQQEQKVGVMTYPKKNRPHKCRFPARTFHFETLATPPCKQSKKAHAQQRQPHRFDTGGGRVVAPTATVLRSPHHRGAHRSVRPVFPGPLCETSGNFNFICHLNARVHGFGQPNRRPEPVPTRPRTVNYLRPEPRTGAFSRNPFIGFIVLDFDCV